MYSIFNPLFTTSLEKHGFYLAATPDAFICLVLEDDWNQGGFSVVFEVGGVVVSHLAHRSTGALESGPGKIKDGLFIFLGSGLETYNTV